MRRLAIATVVLLGAAGGVARADAPAAPAAPASDRDGNDLGADAIVIAPFGDWAHQAGVGLGGDVRVRVPLSDYTTITARVGGVAHLGKTMDVAGVPATTTILEFPLLGGARYYVSAPGGIRGFFSGEVGVVFRRTDVAFAGAHDHDVKVVFGSSVGAGLTLGRFEVAASVWFSDLGELQTHVGAMVTAGGTLAHW